MDTARSNPQTQPAIMIIVGSVIAAVSTLLLWMKLEAQDTETVEAKGLDLDMGALVLLMAVVAVILAVIQMLRGANGKGRGQAIANIVITSFIVLGALYVVAAPGDAFAAQAADEVAAQFGISEDFAEEAIKEGVDAGQVDVSAQIGAFLGLLGGLIALAGSIMGTIRGKRSTASGLPAGDPNAPPVPGHRAEPGDPGALDPGRPQVGGRSPTDPGGTAAPPHGTPPGGPDAPRS